MVIDDNGVWIETQFKGKKGTWVLVGSRSNGNIFNTIDTLKCVETQEYIEVERIKIKNFVLIK
jgi:hypothetical protein